MSEIEQVKQEVITNARDSVEEHGLCVPVVVALEPTGKLVFHLEWRSAEERDGMYAGVQEVIDDYDAHALVYVFPSNYTKPEEPHDSYQAITVIVDSIVNRQLTIIPYMWVGDECQWSPAHVTEDFTTTFLSLPLRN